jgi:hypothetical protein
VLRDSLGSFQAETCSADPRYAAVASLWCPESSEARQLCPYEITNWPKNSTDYAIVSNFPKELLKVPGIVKAIFRDTTLSGGEPSLQLELEPFDWKATLPEHTEKHMNGRIEITDPETKAQTWQSLASIRELLETFFTIKIDFLVVRFAIDKDGKTWLNSLDQLGFYPAVVSDTTQDIKCPGRLCNVAHLRNNYRYSDKVVSGAAPSDNILGEEIEHAISSQSSVFIEDALKRYGFQKIPWSPKLQESSSLCSNCVTARTAIFTAVQTFNLGAWSRVSQRLKSDLQTDEAFFLKCKAAFKA